MRIRTTRLIGRALEAARKALRDLDPDQVPPSLRRVASHSGELTPPLADRLARELDTLEWLRRRAVEAWPDVDDAEAADRASALFLQRPEGWVIDFMLAAGEAGALAGASEAGRSERDRAGLAREVAAARERERRWRRKAEDAERAVRALRRKHGEPARAERAELERARESLEAARTQWDEERSALDAAVFELTSEVDMLRDELYRTRRDRGALAARLEEMRAGGTWADRDPLALATYLDDVASQARPGGAGEAPVEVDPAKGPVLPPGVTPDEPRALDAVLGHQGPLLVIVDGYNAGMAMSQGSSAEVRARLVPVLERLALVSPPAHRWSVVWDSSLGEAEATRTGRLEVRFAEAGVSADDRVVALVERAEVPVVVVSNDRELRERSERAGALTLWSDALVRWGVERR